MAAILLNLLLNIKSIQTFPIVSYYSIQPYVIKFVLWLVSVSYTIIIDEFGLGLGLIMNASYNNISVISLIMNASYNNISVISLIVNASYNNVSVISLQPVLLVEKTPILRQVTDKLNRITLYRKTTHNERDSNFNR